jgi:hypothetical protein
MRIFMNFRTTISAAGIICADVWNHHRIVTGDQLGWEFLNHIQDGQTIDIAEDGTVTVR